MTFKFKLPQNDCNFGMKKASYKIDVLNSVIFSKFNVETVFSIIYDDT